MPTNHSDTGTCTCTYFVWSDGTVQCTEDEREPYSWMSDDYLVIRAGGEEEALKKAELIEERAWAAFAAANGKHTSGSVSSDYPSPHDRG